MSIAVWTAADTTRGITVAQAASANDVAGLGPELRAIQDGKQAAPAHLTRNGGKSILCGSRAGRGIL
jgi:hypothetical protein